MNKDECRRRMLETRAGLTRDQTKASSLKATANLLRVLDIDSCISFLVYLPIRNELDTRPFISTLLSRGKKVYAPRCSRDRQGDMEFYRVDGLEELSPGYCGIDEPGPSPERLFMNTDKSVCILPGLAFDRQGMRVGYGRGFYDRYLQSLRGPKPYLAGFVHDFQIVDKILRDRWDVPVDVVVTEKRVLWISSKSAREKTLS